ncbi:MAG: DUF2855 family protein [Ilumatobacter sp.]|uniref:DUF2855 family protein n=1 Tax=Ilumatobacter sp. TaxID=1967498 RepID=UPI00391B255E
MTAQHQTLEVRRDEIGTTRLLVEDVELKDGQVRFRVDRFAITANNITYAVFGDMLGYWDFFPSSQPDADDGRPGWGRVPAMGWAEVVESRHDEIAVGRRFYGWYPMASHVVFTPTTTREGFRDDGPHRQAHAPVYRAYVDVESDGMYDEAPDGEDRHAVLRGLFLTGLLAEEFFADGGGSGAEYFGTTRVVVLSASSKTAIGFAQRAALRKGVDVVAVTSTSNREFVENLGFYDQVVTYDEIDEIATEGGAVSIDMAGNPTSLAAVHRAFGDRLAYSMTVGRSHHDAPAAASNDLDGPSPQLFFAPTEVGRRREQWGTEAYDALCASALDEFVDGSRSWLRIDHRFGADAVEAAWREVFDGAVEPAVGVVAAFESFDETTGSSS